MDFGPRSSADSRTAWTRSARLPCAELLHVPMLPDFDRADRIGEFWGYPQSRTFAELLIPLVGPDAGRQTEGPRPMPRASR